jgi:hypothetical protein
MGFWEEYARKALPPAQFRAASKRQADYDRAMGNGQYGGGPSFFGELINGWRASRFANKYWQDNSTMNRGYSPFTARRNSSGVDIMRENMQRDNPQTRRGWNYTENRRCTNPNCWCGQ